MNRQSAYLFDYFTFMQYKTAQYLVCIKRGSNLGILVGLKAKQRGWFQPLCFYCGALYICTGVVCWCYRVAAGLCCSIFSFFRSEFVSLNCRLLAFTNGNVIHDQAESDFVNRIGKVVEQVHIRSLPAQSDI
jgi:hypothetical protein